MSDQSRALLAIGALVVGMALAATGTYLLGTARAVARHAGSERRRRADLGQYLAALAALTGFLLVAGGAAVLVAELLPATEPVRLVSGAVTGVLAFAATGVAFSRVADAAEDARVRRMPAVVYPPVERPADLAAPPMASVQPTPPAQATSSTPEVPSAAPEPPEPPERSGQPEQSAAQAAELGGPTVTTPRQLSSGEGSTSGGTASTATGSGDRILAAAALLRGVRPGWIYRDQNDRWYLGVGDGTDTPLLTLPEFTLVRADHPAFPLVVAGAGEIAVVPVSDEAAGVDTPMAHHS